MGDSRSGVIFAIVDKLAVPIQFKAVFIDKVFRSIHPAEMKIVPHLSVPVPIPIVHGAQSAAWDRSDIQKFVKQGPVLPMTPVSGEPRNITVALQVVLKVIQETSILVSTKEAGLVEVVLHEYVAEIHTYMTANSFTDV